MTFRDTARTTIDRSRAPAAGLTTYGCGPDEAVLFRELAPLFGFIPTISEAAVSEVTVDLVAGNRCVSVGHKTRIADSALRALSAAGVRYLSTRSIGYN